MGRVDSKTSEEGGSRSPAAIRIMRLLLFLLGFLVAASLAYEKHQAEDGGGLSLSAEPGPGKGPEILLRAKRDPKNAGTIRGSQKFKKIKNQKKTDAWKRKQRNKNGKQNAKTKNKKKKKKKKKS